MRKLEREERPATAAEKKTLVQYTGWGWAGEYFNKDNPRYEKQHKELHELLSEAEFKSASASTLNAHYTSPQVIRAMWAMADRLGFKGGAGTTVLEPAGGVGHFFGLMPEKMGGGRMIGIELDSISGRIFKALYPEADIRVQGFEASRIANNSVDLAISNVPFGAFKLKATDYPQLLIHDYFFARSLDKVRPGGLVMFITSDGTLNKGDSRVRKMLAERADLVAAVRLPNNAFAGNAGTEVTTDIIILRKKDGTPFQGESFLSLRTVGEEVVQDRDGVRKPMPIRVNEYFAKHPEMALGKHTLEGTMYAAGDYALVARPGQDTADLLKKIVRKLPANILGEAAPAPDDAQLGEVANEGEKDLSYVMREGKFYQVIRGTLKAPDWMSIKNFGANPDASVTAKEKATRQAIAKDWIGLKAVVQQLFTAENNPATTDADLKKLRRQLNATYDAYVKKHGTLTKAQRHYEKAAFLQDDPDYPLLQAIEDEVVTVNAQTGKEVKSWKKGDIFTKRLRTPKAMPTSVSTADDAIAVSMGYRNQIDLALIAKLLGVSHAGAKNLVIESGQAFEDPQTGLLEPRPRYLSGNVRQKLRAAEQAARDDANFKRNVDALREVQPPDVNLIDIHFDLGSRWIPDVVLEKFAEDVLGTSATIKYVQAANNYAIHLDNPRSPELATTYGTAKMGGADLLRHALAGTNPRVTESVGTGSDKKTVTDLPGTRAAEAALEKMRQAFQTWVKTSGAEVSVDGTTTAVADHMQDVYNETSNSMVAPDYDGSHLVLPGLTDVVYRSKHRMAIIARILQEGAAVMAHGVGSGKTFSQIVAAMEMKRLGLAKKPMIVVQKATIGQFAASFRQAYPDARILVANEKSFMKAHRRKFMSQIALGDYDAVIVTQPQFDRLPNKKEAIEDYYGQLIDELEEAIRTEKAVAGKGSPTTKQLENSKKQLETKLAAAVKSLERRQDDTVFFEDMGVDMLLIDEAHAYKRTPIVTRKMRIKGIPSGSSARAVGLHIKVRQIQGRNAGKGVVLATGTPVTNTMAEAYVMLQLATPRLLDEYRIRNFDDFANTFGVTQTQMEFSWSGKFKLATRFNKFVNGTELVTMIRSGFDVKMGNKELGLKVPKIKGGAPEMVIIPQSASAKTVNAWLLDIAATFEKATDKREVQWVPITAMQAGMAAALDPRLVDPTLPDEADSKVNVAAKRIVEIYKASKATRGTQMVFADRFKPMNVSKLTGFVGGVSGPVEVDLSDLEIDAEAPTLDDEGDGDAEAAARQAAEDADYRSGGFNLYHDLRDKLIKAGIPANEIAIIHDYNTDNKRTKLFEQVNAGKIRVLIGSTEKMGVGVNAQKRLIAAHHLDPPRSMTPAMMEQRNGRIIRQHNDNEEVEILLYGVEKSMDIGIYQMLEAKQRMIVQVLSAQGVGRTFEDAADEVVMSMSQMKAMLTGDGRALRLSEIEQQLRTLYERRTGFENEKLLLRRKLRASEAEIEQVRGKRLPRMRSELAAVESDFAAGEGKERAWRGVFGGHAYTERADIVKALDQAMVRISDKHESYASFTLNGWSMRLMFFKPFKDGVGFTQLQVFEGDRRVVDANVKSGNGVMMALAQMPRTMRRRLEEAQQRIDKLEAGLPAMRNAIQETWDKGGEIEKLEREREEIQQSLMSDGSKQAMDILEASRQFEGENIRPDFGRPEIHGGKLPGQDAHIKVKRPRKGDQAKPATKAGAKLVDAIEADPKGEKVGMRSIVQFVTDLVKAELRVGLEQTTQKSPAHYMEGDYHLIRTKTDTWQLNFHEAGHALAALLRETAPDFLKTLGGRLTALASRPGSMASAKTAEEGFAEWVRLSIVDPEAIPREITKRLEAKLKEHAPQILDGINDARLAFAAHLERDVDATFASYMRDRAKPMPTGQRLELLWHEFLYALSAGTALGSRVHKKVFSAIRKFSLDLARQFERETADTAADYRNAYQMTLHVPQEVARAMYGAKKGDEGLRVLTTGTDPLRPMLTGMSDEDQLSFIQAFDLGKASGGGRHGNYLYLNNYSIQSIIDKVGKDNWDAFELYIWRRAALSRYRKKGHRYPGLTEDQSPGVMEERIREVEMNHPDWRIEADRLKKWLNQLLIVSVLNGEVTPKQAMEMVDTYEFYIPLNRAVQRTPKRRNGKGAEPTAGLWYAFGSDIPFEHVLDAIENAVRMSYEAYYHSRVMWAVHEMGQRLSEMKSVPLEARAIGRRIMVPLQLDWKKVATLEVTEQQQVIAQYLNEQLAKQKNIKLEDVPQHELVEPDDVVIALPGADIWRQVKPKAIRIVAPWHNGERKYFQIEDPLLFEFFARTRKPIAALVALGNMMAKVVRPWKRGITHTWPFALWNVTSRDPSTAMLLGQDKTSWLPMGYMLRAVLNRLTGKVPAAISQSELLSKALDATNTKAHQTAVEKFARVLTEGIAVEGWSRMTWGQRLLEVPGQAVSTIMKPIDILNYLTLARSFAEYSEALSREGAFIAAKERGLSDEAAQAQYDYITGNFGERSGSPTLAALFRGAGFLNPGLQVLVQTGYRVFPADRPRLPGKLGAIPIPAPEAAIKIAYIGLIAAVASVINYLLLDDEDKKQMRERTDEDRARYMNWKVPLLRGVRIRVPFDYGPAGAAATFGWNMTEGWLLNEPVKGDVLAWVMLERALSLPAVTDVFGPHIKSMIELKTNHSFFFDSSIVPPWMEAAYPKNPELQAFADTPGFYRWIGQKLGVSPIKVEYAMRNAFTNQFTDTLETAEKMLGGKAIAGELADAPYLGRLFTRESRGWRSKSMQELGDLDAAYSALRTTQRKLVESGEGTPEQHQDLSRKMSELAHHHAHMTQIRKIWKAVKELRKDPEANRAEIERLERLMTDLARQHLRTDEPPQTPSH